MRPTQIDHLADLVEKRKSFKLIPYGNESVLSFEAHKTFWTISSPQFLSYPEELKVTKEGDTFVLDCYFEGGHVIGYEFNLDNFFNVLAWIPGEEVKE